MKTVADVLSDPAGALIFAKSVELKSAAMPDLLRRLEAAPRDQPLWEFRDSLITTAPHLIEERNGKSRAR